MRSLLPGSKLLKKLTPLHEVMAPPLPTIPSSEVLARMELLEKPGHPVPVLKLISGQGSLVLFYHGEVEHENWLNYSALYYLQVSSVPTCEVILGVDDSLGQRDIARLKVREHPLPQEEEAEEEYPEEEDPEPPEEEEDPHA